VYEAPAIIGTCINCISPGSLSATLALIVIGAGIASAVERRKLARARAGNNPVKQKDRPEAVSIIDATK
jgi:hypothetical protein